MPTAAVRTSHGTRAQNMESRPTSQPRPLNLELAFSEAYMQKIVCNSWIAVTLASAAIAWPSYAADSRSFRAEVFFRLENPCPATGQTHGECKGYVIDRIIPVACGGVEESSNMQWQTLAQAREKDRWEKIGCRRGRKLVLPTPAVDAEAFPIEQPPETPQAQPLPRG